MCVLKRTQFLAYIIATTWYVCSVLDHDHVNRLWKRHLMLTTYTHTCIYECTHTQTYTYTHSPMQAHYTVVKLLFHDERRPDSSLCHTGTSFKATSNAPDGNILIFNFVTPKEKHLKKRHRPSFLGLVARYWVLVWWRKQRDLRQPQLSLLTLAWRLTGKCLCCCTLDEGGIPFFQCAYLNNTDLQDKLFKTPAQILRIWKLSGRPVVVCIFNLLLGMPAGWQSPPCKPTWILPPGKAEVPC